MLDAAVREGADHFRELADLEPHHVIHKLRQFGIRLAFERHGDQSPDAHAARLAGEKQGQRAVAGDDADGFGRRCHSPGTVAGLMAVVSGPLSVACAAGAPYPARLSRSQTECARPRAQQSPDTGPPGNPSLRVRPNLLRPGTGRAPAAPKKTSRTATIWINR